MKIEKSGYNNIETLFESASTILYRAKSQTNGKKVIIKTLSKEYPSLQEIRGIRFEFDMLRRLDFPGVAKAYALEELGNKPAIVMEDFGTNDIAALCSADLPLDLFFEIAIKIAGILGNIHRHNIIHKDINPRNILIQEKTWDVRIIDFNNATDLTNEKQDIDTVRQLEGSLAYISPEQTGRMNRGLDYRTDYYSFGVTCFELLTGELPYTADDTMGYVYSHISKPIPDPRKLNPRIPKPVAGIIQKLMSKNAEERYQSSHGLIKDLAYCRDQWQEKAAVEDFILGQHDIPEKFQLPQKLFGRQPEIATLLQAFEAVANGGTELVLVAGHSGVGKSSLVNEVQKPIVDKNGFFSFGKFDPFERNVPYSALTFALKGLVKQLLFLSDTRLEIWQDKLKRILGANAGLLIELVPEFEIIIGQYPPIPQLNPREAQVRLQTVFGDVVGLFASKQHPLVIFLDDLQWSDSATLDLLSHVIDRNIGYLLLIGAYRNDELTEGHPFWNALNHLQQESQDTGRVLRTIDLTPLNQATIRQMLAEVFHQRPEETDALATLIYRKSKGNPFYTIGFLTTLNQIGAFEFKADEGRWSFDLRKIEEKVTEEDVIGFLVQQLKQLPLETQNILMLAACIGNKFNLGLLSLISKKSLVALTELLWNTVQQGILMPFDSTARQTADVTDGTEASAANVLNYRFQHDRILQAVKSQIAEEEIPRIHLEIGRSLLSAATKDSLEQGIFDLVSHLNISRHLITDQGELRELLNLNRIAGKKAKKSVAYAIAAEYFIQALAIVNQQECPLEPEERFELNKEYAECVYLAGDVDQAMKICDSLFPLAISKIDRASVYVLKARMLDHQARLLESLVTIREGLKIFDIFLPEQHQEIDEKLKEGVGKLLSHLAKTPIEELANLPEMKDEEKILAMNLLYEAIPPAIQTYPPLFFLADLMMFDLSMTYGTTMVSCKNFVDCGIVMGNILGDYPAAYKFGEVAFALIEKYQAVALQPAVNFVFASYISQWRVPYQVSLDFFMRTKQSALAAGDVQILIYAYGHYVHRLFYVGTSFEKCDREITEAVSALEKRKAYGPLDLVKIFKYIIRRLGTRSAKDSFGKAEEGLNELFQSIKQTDNVVNLFLFAQGRALSCYLLDELQEAEKWDTYAVPFAAGGEGMFSMPDYYLIKSLIVTKTWDSIPEELQPEKKLLLEQNLARLQKWATNSPANFSHKYLLLAAEVARIMREPLETIIGLYDQALNSIGDGEFIQMKALINELYGKFWLAQKQKRIAKIFMLEAYRLYEQWGAYGKVDLLERNYFDWFAIPIAHGSLHPNTSSIEGKYLDISSIIKTTQAISSEIKLEKLQKRLILTLMENAGAQRGFFIVKNETDQKLYVEAFGDATDIQVHQALLLENKRLDLCVDMVHYVARSQQAVVVNNAQKEGDYRTNGYIKRNNVKSVLCLPIMHHNTLKGILYLENNLVPNAFLPSHITVLNLIASQIAISLENAYVYNNLDELVKKRTAQLETAQAELVENAHKVGMSDIATNILHNVGNILNSLKTTGYLLKETITHSRVNYLTKANMMLRENLSDLKGFVLDNPNGEKLLRYYLDIGDALAEENTTSLDHLKRMQENIENIVTMISAQQRFVYTSTFTELVDVRDIIENALAIGASELNRSGIVITKEFAEVPKLNGHKVKLMHILVNLIKNAEEAILKNPGLPKRIDLTVKSDQNRVLIIVADSGCGIEKANLTKVFSYGYTTKQGSQGIGLHSSAIYISEMNGRIWAESAGKDKGTTIHLSFPVPLDLHAK